METEPLQIRLAVRELVEFVLRRAHWHRKNGFHSFSRSKGIG